MLNIGFKLDVNIRENFEYFFVRIMVPPLDVLNSSCLTLCVSSTMYSKIMLNCDRPFM